MQPLVRPKVLPKLLSKLRILRCLSKTWLIIRRKGWWLSLVWWNSSISQICLFFACYIFCYWGKLPSHEWPEKNCVYEAPPLFFPWNTSDYLHLLKIIIRVDFCSNIFTKPKNINENSQTCMAGECPLGKFVFFFKTMKNIKIAGPVLTMNSFYD